jgi:hypothetical protein
MTHRPTARGTSFLILIALLCAGVASAAPTAKVPRLVFPVLGEATYTDDFGDARGQGSHEGNDIMAPRRALALATEAGRVKFWTTSARAGCMLYLEGASGTEYLYIHLNNDLTDGNDNGGSCVAGVAYAKGLKSGDKVAAGEPIGYVGDSGDANGIHPHLHFEVHPGGGGATNPFPHLRKARRLLFSAAPGSLFTLALTGTVVATETEGLQLKLARVRSWPGGRLIPQVGQLVDIDVPIDASIEGLAGAAALAIPTVEAVEPGSTVTVWTSPAKVTFAAQAGEQGALSAARVVVK